MSFHLLRVFKLSHVFSNVIFKIASVQWVRSSFFERWSNWNPVRRLISPFLTLQTQWFLFSFLTLFPPMVEIINACTHLVLPFWTHSRTVLPGPFQLARATVSILIDEVSVDACIVWRHSAFYCCWYKVLQHPLPHQGHRYASSPIDTSYWESAGTKPNWLNV